MTDKTKQLEDEIIEPYYLEYTEICNRCKKEHKFFMFKRIDKGHGTRLCCLDCYFKQIKEELIEEFEKEHDYPITCNCIKCKHYNKGFSNAVDITKNDMIEKFEKMIDECKGYNYQVKGLKRTLYLKKEDIKQELQKLRDKDETKTKETL